MKQQINLYAEEFRPETNAFQSLFMFQAAGVLVLALVAIYLFAHSEVAGVEVEIQQVSRLESAALDRLKTVGPLILSLTGEQSWAQQLDDANRTLAERQAVLNLINSTTLGKPDGFSGQLHALSRQDVDGIWLTRIVLSAAGNSTRIEGRTYRAELIPVYVQDLTAEPSFATLRFHRFQIANEPDNADAALRFSMDSQLLSGAKTGTGT